MRVLKIFMIIFILVGTNGCKKTIMLLYGIKDPKLETKETLEKYIKKKNWLEHRQLTFSFEEFVTTINDIGVPEVRIFDNHGLYIPYPGEGNCSSGADEFIEKLKYPLEFSTTDSIQLDLLKNGYRDLEGEKIDWTATSDVDFTLLIYWAKFAGRVSWKSVDQWIENVNNNKNASFRIFLVNCDYQEWWKYKEGKNKLIKYLEIGQG